MAEVDPSRLIAALADIERHVSELGWDQPARLFALVETATLLDLEPQLRGKVTQTAADALTAVEQEDFQRGGDIAARLARLTWPATVTGCAIAMERAFLPPRFESQVPADPDEAIEFVNNHEARTDVRVVVGALRDGARHGLARVLSTPDDLLGAEDLVPGLADALLATFKEENA